MRIASLIALGFAALLPAAWACNSSGGGGSGDGGSTSEGDGGGAGGGTVTFSCNGGGMCTGIDGVPSDTAGEKAACAKQIAMTFAVAPCPSANLIACCTHPLLVAGQNEEECYYAPDYSNPNSLSVVQGLCGKLHYTWVPDGGTAADDGGDAGAGDASVGPSSFVGTWARSGTQIVTCPTGSPNTTNVAGNLVITLGTTGDTIVGTSPDGCATTYTVSGETATAAAGQSCMVTLDGGAQETVTVTMHTLVLSADGTTLTSTASATIDKLATGTTCTSASSGTFTKK